jgi:hypothetical protein
LCWVAAAAAVRGCGGGCSCAWLQQLLELRGEAAAVAAARGCGDCWGFALRRQIREAALHQQVPQTPAMEQSCIAVLDTGNPTDSRCFFRLTHRHQEQQLFFNSLT